MSRFAESDVDEVIVTDTIPLSADARAALWVHQISFGQLLAAMMTRISNEESVSSLLQISFPA